MFVALADRLLFGFLRRAPGRLVAAVALIFYPGLGLMLPLASHSSPKALVELNVLGAVYAAIVAFGWLQLQIEARDRRHLVEWTTDLRNLDAEEFEWLVGEVWRREGWTVSETGRQDIPDGNVDLVLSRKGERKLVQCKRWEASRVGVADVRGFAGTLMRLGLPGSAGIFVTLSTFGGQALSEGKSIGLTMLDGRDLYNRLRKVRKSEPCPVCQAPMALSRSQYGWWLRCQVEGCRGKRDLSNEPARALEFLAKAS